MKFNFIAGLIFFVAILVMWILNIFKLFTYKCGNCSYKGPLIKLSFWSIARFFTGFIIPELIAEHKCPKCGSINIKLIK